MSKSITEIVRSNVNASKTKNYGVWNDRRTNGGRSIKVQGWRAEDYADMIRELNENGYRTQMSKQRNVMLAFGQVIKSAPRVLVD